VNLTASRFNAVQDFIRLKDSDIVCNVLQGSILKVEQFPV
jgi:hypothetical protein